MIVYTVGTWDMLHVGHLTLLEHCASLGDTLVVGVAADEVVNSYKPRVPIVPLEQRLTMLAALRCVDQVRPYHQLEYVSGCEAVHVDIFVVGEDWGNKQRNRDVEAYLRQYNKKIIQVSYSPQTSSTKIKNTVLAQRKDDRHSVHA